MNQCKPLDKEVTRCYSNNLVMNQCKALDKEVTRCNYNNLVMNHCGYPYFESFEIPPGGV